MLLLGQDPHEMCDPLHHPLIVAALQEEGADAALDAALELSLLNRFLDTRELAKAA